jgi:hypothetical protein
MLLRNIKLKMKIELVDAMPDLVDAYEMVVLRAIGRGLITLNEWNKKFKYYRDDAGYSFIHLLEGKMSGKIDVFLTENPIMIENREELEDRFGIKIMNMKEFVEEEKLNNEKEK